MPEFAVAGVNTSVLFTNKVIPIAEISITVRYNQVYIYNKIMHACDLALVQKIIVRAVAHGSLCASSGELLHRHY